MRKIFYLLCTIILCLAFSSCETQNIKKCWYVTIDAEFIVKDHPNESWSTTIEAYIWQPETQVEKEVNDMIKEIKEEFEDYDEVNIINKTWKITDIETEESCKETNGEIERRWGSDYW